MKGVQNTNVGRLCSGMGGLPNVLTEAHPDRHQSVSTLRKAKHVLLSLRALLSDCFVHRRQARNNKFGRIGSSTWRTWPNQSSSIPFHSKLVQYVAEHSFVSIWCNQSILFSKTAFQWKSLQASGSLLVNSSACHSFHVSHDAVAN